MDNDQQTLPPPTDQPLPPAAGAAGYVRRSLLMLLDAAEVDGAIITEPDFSTNNLLGKCNCLENIVRIERALWRLHSTNGLQTSRGRELVAAHTRERSYYRSHCLFLGERSKTGRVLTGG